MLNPKSSKPVFLHSSSQYAYLFLLCTDRLECFMKFLEGRCSTDTKWCWKIHCKTQKKLKELARSV